MFDIVFSNLIGQLTPHALRKPIMLVWLNSLLSPLASLYTRFRTFRSEKLFEVSINGQVCYLEYLLNLEFYQAGYSRKIWISDGDTTEDTFIYNASESEEELFIFNYSEPRPNTYIFNQSETTDVGFIVWVPTTLDIANPAYINGLINKYKLAGSNYIIKPYIEIIDPH